MNPRALNDLLEAKPKGPLELFHGTSRDRPMQAFGGATVKSGDTEYHQNGPGIYLTKSFEEAVGYGKVWKVTLSPNTRFLRTTDRVKWSITQTLLRQAPDLEDAAWDWDPHGEGNVRRAMNAVLEVHRHNPSMSDVALSIHADFYRREGGDAKWVEKMAQWYDAYIPDVAAAFKDQHVIVYNLGCVLACEPTEERL